MSIDAVFPAIGGIGIRLTGTVVRFAAIEGRSVGADVAPTGRLACAGPVSTVCEAHGVGLGDAVAAGTDAAATVGDAVVLGVLQAIASAATLMNLKTGRTEECITTSPSRCAAAKIPHAVPAMPLPRRVAPRARAQDRASPSPDRASDTSKYDPDRHVEQRLPEENESHASGEAAHDTGDR